MIMYTKDNLPGDPRDWPRYQKVPLISAIRISGPFTVMTREGPLECEDGYLALDSKGYPYPIAADEFYETYRIFGGVIPE